MRSGAGGEGGREEDGDQDDNELGVCARPTKNGPKFLLLTRCAQIDPNCSSHSFCLDTADDPSSSSRAAPSVSLPVVIVTKWDILVVLLSLLGYCADLISDWLVAHYHYSHGRPTAALLIMLFAVIPTLLLNLLSLGWYIESPQHMPHEFDHVPPNDHRRQRQKRIVLAWRFVACLLQLGPVLYHFDWLWYAMRLRKRQQRKVKRLDGPNGDEANGKGGHFNEKPAELLKHRRTQFENDRHTLRLSARLLNADRDATLLRMFEAFLESTPQLLVQLYLVLDVFVVEHRLSGTEQRHGHPPNYVLLLAGVLFSLFSLTWAIVAQHRSLRLARLDKNPISIFGCVLQGIWRVLTVAPRLLCLCLFTVVFKFWIVVVFVVHFVIALLHLLFCQNINFGSHWFIETLVIVLGAVVNVFTPFNMSEGRTRWRYAFLYTLEFIENVLLLLVVLIFLPKLHRPRVCRLALIALISWSVGVIVMLLYYRFAHPNVLARSKPSTDNRVPSRTPTYDDLVGQVRKLSKQLDPNASSHSLPQQGTTLPDKMSPLGIPSNNKMCNNNNNGRVDANENLTLLAKNKVAIAPLQSCDESAL